MQRPADHLPRGVEASGNGQLEITDLGVENRKSDGEG